MHSSITLPYELWVDIVQYLKLRDLLTLCEAYHGTADAHVVTPSGERAEKLLYSIFTTSKIKTQFYVRSNGKRIIPYSKHWTRRLYPYSYSPSNAHRSFVPTSDSKVKMDISAWTNLWN